MRAPGRVNLIGDHTDHEDGFVLPMAVDREVWLAARRADDPRVQIVSAEEDGLVDVTVPPVAPPEAGRLARLAQRAENDWVGMSWGIVDQLTVAAGVHGAALRIDCRSLEVVPVGLPDGLAVLVLDTGTRRELASSAYNTRRAECDEASAALGVDVLRGYEAATGAPPTVHLCHAAAGAQVVLDVTEGAR